MAIVAVWTAGIFLFDIFECTPFSYQWDYTILGGTCAPGDSLVSAGYAFSVLSVLSDWLYALLPILMLWNVKMNRQTKVVVVVILSLGALYVLLCSYTNLESKILTPISASIATLIRIKYLIDLVSPDDILCKSSLLTQNVTYMTTTLTIPTRRKH
jgi:hypothetical protein